MRKGFGIAFGIGLLLIGAVVWTVFYAKEGAHMVPQGSILKIRAAKIEDARSLMVIDFRVVNNADRPIVVRQVDVTVETKNGNTASGLAISASDADKLFGYYPLLGERYNDPLRPRDKLAGHQPSDRMMAFQIDLPIADLESRKKVTMRIEDVTGPVAEFSSK